ncbi:hypothetical protein ABVT39_005737 [Epinephelus coioides]
MRALSDLDGPRWGFALSYLLELYNEVEDLLFHATISTPFLCIALLSPKTIQSVMRLSPEERSIASARRRVGRAAVDTDHCMRTTV